MSDFPDFSSDSLTFVSEFSLFMSDFHNLGANRLSTSDLISFMSEFVYCLSDLSAYEQFVISYERLFNSYERFIDYKNIIKTL